MRTDHRGPVRRVMDTQRRLGCVRGCVLWAVGLAAILAVFGGLLWLENAFLNTDGVATVFLILLTIVLMAPR